LSLTSSSVQFCSLVQNSCFFVLESSSLGFHSFGFRCSFTLFHCTFCFHSFTFVLYISLSLSFSDASLSSHTFHLLLLFAFTLTPPKLSGCHQTPFVTSSLMWSHQNLRPGCAASDIIEDMGRIGMMTMQRAGLEWNVGGSGRV